MPCNVNRSQTDEAHLRRALQLARRGCGRTSPNPMVGAVLVHGGKVIGEGWHRRAGGPHAEVEALRDAARRGERVRGAALYVTLEPCCTHGRTPPCTQAISSARAAAWMRATRLGATGWAMDTWATQPSPKKVEARPQVRSTY